MATATINYSAEKSVTITLTSLASNGYKASAAVDNSTDKFIDALVGGIIEVGSVNDGYIEIYAYGSYDGTNYSYGLTGGDDTVTWGTTGNTGLDGFNDLRRLGIVTVDATDDNDDVRWGPFSVASVFGGVLPVKWGIVVRNVTGGAFNATGTPNECSFIGIKYDIA